MNNFKPDELNEVNRLAGKSLIHILEDLNDLFPGHGFRLQEMSRIWLNEFPGSVKMDKEEDVYTLYFLCNFHDLGKLITKSEDQMNSQRRHCLLGNLVAEAHPELSHIKDLILFHHESYDGWGCFGVIGKSIPFFNRMLSILNNYDSLVYGRCYNYPQISKEAALERLVEEAGRKLDPELVPIALQVMKREGQEISYCPQP